MFDTGYVLFCKNFKFNNGGEPKDKYFVVLKRNKDSVIIGSLPTRTNKVPNFIYKSHGCVNKDDRCFNCYHFEANRSICDNGFCFDLPTFIYGDEIETYHGPTVDANYQINVSYQVEGKLTQQEYTNIINCIMNSTSVKRKIRRLLS